MTKIQSLLSRALLVLPILTLLVQRADASCGGACGTTVPTGTYFSTTWTKAGSPYCVTGSITLANVNIEPGVCVRVSPGASITVGVGLIADGTALGLDEPITFGAENATLGWSGLVFNGTASTPPSVLRLCVIEDTGTSGVRITNATPTIEYCTFRRCGRDGTGGSTAGPTGGGALSIANTGVVNSMALLDCTIEDCYAASSGGGVNAALNSGAQLLIERCVFSRNRAGRATTPTGNRQGGALNVGASSGFGVLRVEGCHFKANSASSFCNANSCTATAYGGGACIVACDARFQSTVFERNYANGQEGESLGFGTSRGFGGAIYYDASGRTLDVVNTILGGNRCITSGNTVIADGAGVYVTNGTANITNCTIARSDSEGISRSGGTVNVTNSILWQNNSSGAQTSGGSISFTYSCVQAASPVCPTCINSDPAFWGTTPPASPNAAALRIVPFSPCIDAGDPSSAFDDCGLNPTHGTPRNDMGAHGGPMACEWRNVGHIIRLCNATPNSTGLPGRIEWVGSTNLAATPSLVASQLPPNTPGIFFYGVSHVQEPFGDGNRCVTGNVIRLPPAYSDASGVASLILDRASIPQLASLQPGDVRSFQYWYRNPAGGAAGFNLTDALEVFFSN